MLLLSGRCGVSSVSPVLTGEKIGGTGTKNLESPQQDRGRKYAEKDKDREITYQVPSLINQAWLEEH